MLWVITLALAAGTCVEVPLPLIDEALISGSRILISDKLEKLCLEYDGGMLNVFKHILNSLPLALASFPCWLQQKFSPSDCKCGFPQSKYQTRTRGRGRAPRSDALS